MSTVDFQENIACIKKPVCHLPYKLLFLLFVPASSTSILGMLSRLKSGMSWTGQTKKAQLRVLSFVLSVASPRGFEPLLPA